LTEGTGANFDARELDLPQLREFYARRSYQPAWSGSTEAVRDAKAALDALARAGNDGLDPAAYHWSEIRLRQGAATGEGNAQFEILLTDGVLRYARDLRSGRPALARLDRDVELPGKAFNFPQALDEALRSGRLAELLGALAPPQPAYGRLKGALQRYRKIVQGGGWPQVWDAADTGQLNQRLAVENGVEPSDLPSALVEFQRRHGLEPDGRLGKKTLQALNVPAAVRVETIAANMERWRWLPRDLGHRYVMVNAADATLVVVEDGHVVLRSKVIVGKPSSRTAIFSASITAITVNPEWNIPAPIARNEILPKARRNPAYLGNNHIVIDPSGRLRQLPGPDNALGLLKMEMANRFNEYLHDTPSRSLFTRDERHLSHGCIRVEQIQPLASFALTGDAVGGLQQIQAEIGPGVNKRISLDNPLPVFVVYWTVIVNDDGSVDFLPDVYGRDQRLLAAVAGKPLLGRVTLNAGECRKV
jgi:murein L,D-transpeptidase YcbB/YkuD